MGRSPCSDNNSLKKGPWTLEEDHKLVQYIQLHGPGNWRNLPKNAGLQRCGKSCRLRWTNYLRPDIKRGRFSFEEEEAIIQLHSVLGNKWSTIASRLPGRTDNEIKNYWNTHIRKRLLKMGIDPVTHRSRLDLVDLSNALNYSNLLGLQSLVNPELLNLFTTLVASNQANQLFDQTQLQNQTNGFQDCSTSSFPTSIHNQFINQMEPRQGEGEVEFGQNFQENLTPYDLSVVNSPDEAAFGLLNSNNQNFMVNPLISTTDVSSHTQLDSPSTFAIGSTEDERDTSYCSSLLELEFPGSLHLGDFM